MTEKTTVGDVCFIRKHGKVLLLRRNKEPMKGKWTGVGGKTEFDEEPMESCLREVKEETGLDITEPRLAAVMTTINKPENSKWFLFVYLAGNPHGRLKESSEGRLKWVNEQRLYEEDLFGFIRAFLPHAMKKSKGVITGKIVHDEKGEVLDCILRDDKNILVQIPKKPR